MDIQIIAELLQVALPTGLIVVGLWWALSEGWPYWKQRDVENREREHEREMKQIAAQQDTARATTRFADALEAFTHVLSELCGKQSQAGG